jgi:hypothetical protein
MPGRPKMTAKKIEEIEVRMFGVNADLFCDAPKRIIENPDEVPEDDIGKAWCVALHWTTGASTALTMLADKLRARAGIPGPGPVARAMGDDGSDGAAEALAGRDAGDDDEQGGDEAGGT